MYDPPHFAVAQLKTEKGQREAFRAVLIDLVDVKYLEAFLHWIPSMMQRAYTTCPERKKMTCHQWCKSWIEKVSAYSPKQRLNWYLKRRDIMLKDEKIAKKK